MHDLHCPWRMRTKDLPRVERDGAIHGLLLRLYEQGHETLCGLVDFEADTLPSSNAITCVSCLALHDDDLAHIEATRLYNDHQGVCKLVAEMHAAAVGYVGGPNRGVVEDVADLKAERDRLRESAALYDRETSALKRRIEQLEREKQFLYLKAMAP